MEPLLKDLYALINKTKIHYDQDCPQDDAILSESFQNEYRKFLINKGYSIDYNKCTALIVTSNNHYIFTPNQWFVIAAYGVGVYEELMKYKDYLIRVCDELGKKPQDYIPYLRDYNNLQDREQFFNTCNIVFANLRVDDKKLASERLWKFATDYTWWSGSKTINRTDFHLSVILNMLNLVNVSQGFVGDIVSHFSSQNLKRMVHELEDFTENLEGITFEITDYDDPISDNGCSLVQENSANYNEDWDDGEEIIISVRKKK